MAALGSDANGDCMRYRLAQHRLQAGAVSPVLSAAFVFVVAAIATIVSAPRPAQAIPAFARQTGQPCATCHTDFPQLTPYGRRFKLGGFTAAGGRTSEVYQKAFGSDGFVPGVSFMAVVGATRQDTLSPNIQQQATFSEFYGGTIAENTGTFIDNIGVLQQATYTSGAGLHNFSWDNTDLRYADTATIGKIDFIYGITANNNPTVQDVWNTAPAWAFPFAPSIANNPAAASTLIEGTFAQRVVGASAYTFINDMLYLEAGGYKGVNPNVLDKLLGVDPTAQPGTIDRLAPYFRVAVEPHWGDHWVEVGAFGMRTDVNPQGLSPDLFNNPFQVAAGVMPPLGAPGLTDRFSDLGFDAQYQYMGDRYKVTVRATYIHENQLLNSSFAGGASTNPTDTLNSFKANASLAYGEDSRVIFTGGHFNTWGSSDMGLYSAVSVNNNPNTAGWVAEIAYIPFGMSRSPLWPYFNARLGLLYTAYDKVNGASINYDGLGTNARDNNALQAYVWIAF
jgi:hypothetical protein